MPFNFSSPEYLSHHRTRKNRVSPVSRASPAHMNSPLHRMVWLGIEMCKIQKYIALIAKFANLVYICSHEDKPTTFDVAKLAEKWLASPHEMQTIS